MLGDSKSWFLEVNNMRIEHIAMYVNDLEKEKAFFETYFDAKAGDKYVHEEIGFSSYFLEFQDGAHISWNFRMEQGWN